MMSHRHLVLRLEAPLMAFGGAAIDNYGVTRDFPSASMITGLIANALGWKRSQSEAHARLQQRLVFGARREREPHTGHFRDVQNARLHQKDQGWTTRGQPEGRASSPSYKSEDDLTPELGRYLLQRRHRDYHADALSLVVFRLDPDQEDPTLDGIAAALDRPARPLFIGRKPCLPSLPLLAPGTARWIEARTIHDALTGLSPMDSAGSLRAIWPAGEGPSATTAGPETATQAVTLCDERDWDAGFHAGSRIVIEGLIEGTT